MPQGELWFLYVFKKYFLDPPINCSVFIMLSKTDDQHPNRFYCLVVCVCVWGGLWIKGLKKKCKHRISADNVILPKTNVFTVLKIFQYFLISCRIKNPNLVRPARSSTRQSLRVFSILSLITSSSSFPNTTIGCFYLGVPLCLHVLFLPLLSSRTLSSLLG